MEDNKILFEIIDKQTRTLVGVLCKRIEILEKNRALSPSLYKDLSKETIYEWSRQLKIIIDIGSVKFISKK